MSFSNYTIDHIGIAVRDLEKSLHFYKQNFGFEVSHREKIASQSVEVVFLNLPNTKLELLGSLNQNSKLAAFLEKRGEGLHHICYRVSNIIQELARLKALGFELIDQVPRPGAHSSQIAFVHPKSTEGVLTELCQY